ncbi:MAG: DUF3786 domain-containing protein [Clostridiales bacterium]|nr:DUF3786 domain-containing protein [Clostridiales bacterium]MCF8021101.1 DUF3786 domain-containing protein [Clostridiales bacterium]
MCNVVNAYHLAVKKFMELDHKDIELRCGTVFDKHEQAFFLDYFGRKCKISWDGMVTCDGEEVDYNDRTIIMQYLCYCSGLPPRGKWISFLDLPGGDLHHGPFQKDGTIPLAKNFDNKLKEFESAALNLGGTSISPGDAGFYVPALPKLPMAVTLWEGDEEFPARANILFDSVAPNHLSTAALWVLGIELVTKMLKGIDTKAAQEQTVDWFGK